GPMLGGVWSSDFEGGDVVLLYFGPAVRGGFGLLGVLSMFTIPPDKAAAPAHLAGRRAPARQLETTCSLCPLPPTRSNSAVLNSGACGPLRCENGRQLF